MGNVSKWRFFQRRYTSSQYAYRKMFNTFVIRKTQIQSIVGYHYNPGQLQPKRWVRKMLGKLEPGYHAAGSVE